MKRFGAAIKAVGRGIELAFLPTKAIKASSDRLRSLAASAKALKKVVDHAAVNSETSHELSPVWAQVLIGLCVAIAIAGVYQVLSGVLTGWILLGLAAVLGLRLFLVQRIDLVLKFRVWCIHRGYIKPSG